MSKPAKVAHAQPATEPAQRYVNRELSWLQFNARVLDEGASNENPLLERLKFLAICESNLDEFYMVRVSGLIEQFESGVLELSPDGLAPNDQLRMINEAAQPLRQRCWDVLERDLLPLLAKKGVLLSRFDDLTMGQRKAMNAYFLREVFPLLTPLMLRPASTVPFISNRSLNVVVEANSDDEVRLARIKVPTVLPRFVRAPGKRMEFIPLEDLILANLSYLFPGVSIRGAHLFRVIRDADVEIRELEASDLMHSVEQTIRLRRFGDPVLLHVEEGMPADVREFLRQMLALDPEDVFVLRGLLALEGLHEIAALPIPTLRYPPFAPHLDEHLASTGQLLDTLKKSEVAVHQPFDSFRSVEHFIDSAATDPSVVGIKQTMYRVGTSSPIVESLQAASEAGKQVAAMVELKARFDESNNLGWARALERAGVHVTYGFPEMKTHCKLSLMVRREAGGVRTYAHIGTGNYNPETARLYTDLGLFTADPDITNDISELFNYLTGFSRQTTYRKILVAPVNLRESMLDLIHAETKIARKSGAGRLIFKLNALVDPEMIEAMYAASQAGVEIDLIVRGVCCLRPGVKGMSEKIRVMSVVGRFLEHSRLYYFGGGGKPTMLLGSADLMRRNLDRRIEVLAPVGSPELIQLLKREVLDRYLKDNAKAWDMGSDGAYRRRERGKGRRVNVQEELIKRPLTAQEFGRNS